jgi:NAD(P)H-dependent flavin oxidoreductase YrpB (nitropropane dioxygenase family)
MMLRTRLCELLGIAHPIVCAPMGWITGPELTAAVSGAGGLGILGAGANPPELLRQKIRLFVNLPTGPLASI